MANNKLTKARIARLVAKEMARTADGLPVMHSAPSKAFAPKVAKIDTAKGKVSQADILKIRREVIDEWIRGQLNY